MDSGMETDRSETAVVNDAKVEIQDGKPVFKPTRNFYLAFSALMILAIAVAFDATTVSVALPTISTALGGTALEAFWTGTRLVFTDLMYLEYECANIVR
jgi:putative Mn2+ efflux pump MntP